MIYLAILNNELQSLMVTLSFFSTIFMTMTMLFEMFSNHKLKINLLVICRILNIILCVILSFIFLNFVSLPNCENLAYFAIFLLVFELVIIIMKKNKKMIMDIPFLIILFPFWKYISNDIFIIFMIIGVIYFFIKSLILFVDSFSILKNNINYYSLKEALDGLEIAVMFEDGYNVIYENSAMKNLLERLDITKNKSLLEIWQIIKLRENSKIVDDKNILVFIDDKVYSFSKTSQSKLQMYAFDITKEYLTTIEIEKKQAELEIKQIDIINMINNLDEIEKQKEVLTLKSKLHDIIGQRLFILHHILDVIDEKTFDLNNVKNMLATMLNEIDNDETSEVKNIQASVITAFEMIGFNIVITGKMPEDVTKTKALVKIIRESATNAIRHANATKLFVNIYDDKIEIFDNGTYHNQAIIEGTGISGMRLNAKELGSELLLSTENGFKIILNFKSN